MRTEIHGYKSIAEHTTERRRLAQADRKMLTRQQAKEVIHSIAPNLEVTFRTGQYGKGFYRNPRKGYPNGHIHFTIPKTTGRISLGIVLHELAHHIHWVNDKQVREAKSTADRRKHWHGPGFVEVLDNLVWGWYLPSEET
jgi:hypothetical protein